MSDIKSLLTETTNPMVKLMSETRGLVTKWEKTGLLRRNQDRHGKVTHVHPFGKPMQSN